VFRCGSSTPRCGAWASWKLAPEERSGGYVVTLPVSEAF
jgi:hypothetical protein